MKLKNYTSNVSVEKSISLIERRLVSAGAIHTSRTYLSDGSLEGMTFQIPVNGIPMIFRVPAKTADVEKEMMRSIKKPQRGTADRIREQAQKTAWKLLVDWVDVNVSMITLKQVEVLEVFLPYHYNPETNKTLFEHVKDRGYKMLEQGRATK